MDYDPILYGKQNEQFIVSIEPGDEQTELFIQLSDGLIISEWVKNRYWILSNESHGQGWVRLAGDLHYKWGKQFDNRQDFLKARQYLKKHDIWSIFNPKEAFMVKDGYTYYKGMKPSDLSILAFDIETTGLNHDDTAKLLCIANTFRDSNGVITRHLFAYDEYASEKEMIDSWCSFVREINPSIICNHNIYGFDFPYLNYIAERANTTLKLGRNDDDIEFDNYESKFRKDGSQTIAYKKCRIYGREIVDTFQLAVKHDQAAKNYESYGLKYIIEKEGLEVKDRVFYDASQIRFNYQDPVEWNKIKQYAEMDGDDALALFDLMIPAYFYLGQFVPKSFSEVISGATGSQINSMMVRAYLQNGHSISKASEINEFQGGISFGIPGIYRNCWKLDIKSAYPSSVLIHKLYDKQKDPNAIMLKLCDSFTKQRFEYKKLYKETKDKKYEALDSSAKIFINSIFGFCGAPGLNFNAPEVAAKITESARNFLNQGMLWATGKDKEYWINLNETT